MQIPIEVDIASDAARATDHDHFAAALHDVHTQLDRLGVAGGLDHNIGQGALVEDPELVFEIGRSRVQPNRTDGLLGLGTTGGDWVERDHWIGPSGGKFAGGELAD